MQHAELTDRVINHHRVGTQIEHRGYCTIYKAFDLQNNGELCLLKHCWDVSEAAARQYEEEWQRHNTDLPEWRSYFQVGDATSHIVEGNGHFSVLTWMGNRTLQEVVNHEPEGLLSPHRAVRYMIQVCRQLEVLHNGAPPIYHKHISPETIVIQVSGEDQSQAVLRDFGLSYVANPHLHNDSRPYLKQDPFAAREQFAPEDTADARTDIYRVGATLSYLVTGRLPDNGQASPSVGNHTRNIRGGNLAPRAQAGQQRPPIRTGPRVNADLEAIMDQAMAPDATQRYQTIADLRQVLTRWQATNQRLHNGPGDNWSLGLFFFIIVAAALAFVFINGSGPDTTNIPAAAAIVGDGGLGPSQVQALPTVPQPTQVPPTATPDVLATVAAVEALLTPIAGPHVAALALSEPHRPAALDAGVILADVNVTATFINPPAVPWDYGFAFRHDPVSHFRFVVGADGSWYVIHVTEAPAVVQNYVAMGQSLNLRLGAGEHNQLRLLALGDTVYFFINGQYEGMASLVGKHESGRVFAATGMHPALSGTWSVSVEAFQVSSPGR